MRKKKKEHCAKKIFLLAGLGVRANPNGIVLFNHLQAQPWRYVH